MTKVAVVGVGYGYEYARRLQGLGLGVVFFQRDMFGCVLGQERTDGTRDENHDDRTVKYVVAEDAQVVRNRHGSQRAGGFGVAEAESQLALVTAEAERFLRQPCRQPFAANCGQRHQCRHQQGAPALGESMQVDKQTYADQKNRDEQRVAYEVDFVHQRREVRNLPVQGQSCQKYAQHRLQARQPRQNARSGGHEDDERIFDYAVVEPFEHLLREARHAVKQCHEHHNRTYTHSHPEPRAHMSARHGCNNRQNNHRRRHGHNSSTDDEADGTIALDVITADHRVGNQRVTAKHRTQQNTGGKVVTEHPTAGRKTKHGGDGKRENTEQHAFVFLALQVAQADFYSGHKHQVQQPQFAQGLDGFVPPDPPQRMRADDDACHNQADDARQMNFLAEDGHYQNDQQDNRDYEQ